MNLTIFILKRYKIGGKNNSSVNIRFVTKYQLSEFSLKTSEVVTRMHIIHVCTLGRPQLCDVQTALQSTLLVVQMPSLFQRWQSTVTPSACYIWYYGSTNHAGTKKAASIFLKSRIFITAWFDNKCFATPCGTAEEDSAMHPIST